MCLLLILIPGGATDTIRHFHDFAPMPIRLGRVSLIFPCPHRWGRRGKKFSSLSILQHHMMTAHPDQHQVDDSRDNPTYLPRSVVVGTRLSCPPTTADQANGGTGPLRYRRTHLPSSISCGCFSCSTAGLH